jgi:formate hydrogenlyase subunit 3/multisubunit Na+/H+ antiporter MnhD subunit
LFFFSSFTLAGFPGFPVFFESDFAVWTADWSFAGFFAFCAAAAFFAFAIADLVSSTRIQFEYTQHGRHRLMDRIQAGGRALIGNRTEVNSSASGAPRVAS